MREFLGRKSGLMKKVMCGTIILGNALFSGCASNPDLLDGYDSITEKSLALLREPEKEINKRVIHKGKLPIYEKKFETKSIGKDNVLIYHSRNMDIIRLGKILEEQLGKDVIQISAEEKTNQLLVRYQRKPIKIGNQIKNLIKDVYEKSLKKEEIIEKGKFHLREFENENLLIYHAKKIDIEKLEKLFKEKIGEGVIKMSSQGEQLFMKYTKNNSVSEKEIKGLIKTIDERAPQIMIDVRIARIFADYTKDISIFMNANLYESNNLTANVGLDLKGAVLRIPERAAMGTKYGIVGKQGKIALDGWIDNLESEGFAEDLANPILTVNNNEKAMVSLIERIPIPEEIFSGGTTVKVIKYHDVKNFLEINAAARDNQEIYLNIKAGVGTVNPSGPLQVPSITKREIDIGGVTLKEGETLIVAGFVNSKKYGIERKDLFFSRIPLIGKLFSATDEEKKVNRILFSVTPNYIDINKSGD